MMVTKHKKGAEKKAQQKRRMNRHVKQRWVAALRSGKYQQCRDTLRSVGDSFCCLGVLCDLYDADGWTLKSDGYRFQPSNFGYQYATTSLPDQVVQWAGLQGNNGCCVVEGIRINLMELNDDQQKTFAEIADVIEKFF